MTSEQYLRLGKTHHLIPPLVFGPAALLQIYFVSRDTSLSWSVMVGLIVGGIALWTLIEYVLHRFAFHLITEKEPWKFLSSGFHLLHHEIPNAPNYVVAPLIFAFPTYLMLIALLWLVTQNLGIALLIASGIAIGYLVYEWIHYFAHHGKARTRVGKYLKQYHMIHHFKDSHNYYGVSSPFWDIVFGTKPNFDEVRETEILPIRSRDFTKPQPRPR